ncbi:MAG: MGMT family protein [Alistipes shahii]
MANNRNPIAIVVPCHRVVAHGRTDRLSSEVWAETHRLDLEKLTKTGCVTALDNGRRPMKHTRRPRPTTAAGPPA